MKAKRRSEIWGPRSGRHLCANHSAGTIMRPFRPLVILPFQGGRWNLHDIGYVNSICKIWPNQVASPNRRPRFAEICLFFLRSTCLPGGGR